MLYSHVLGNVGSFTVPKGHITHNLLSPTGKVSYTTLLSLGYNVSLFLNQ